MRPMGTSVMADPFPPRAVCAHSYCPDIHVLTSGTPYTTSTTAGTVVVNDMFAPGGTTAHQPYGFDQMTALYNKFKVRKAVIEVEYIHATTAAVGWIGICVPPPASAFTYTSIGLYQLIEQPCCTVLQSANQVLRSFKQEVDFLKLYGCTKAEFDADLTRFCGTASASPPVLIKCILVNAAPGTNDTGFCQVRITYEVEWFDRITQNPS